MRDLYAVVGNPIAHSKSPDIHAAFARQVGHELSYIRLEAPLGEFSRVVNEFRQQGGRGLNVTAPFKLEAFTLAAERSPRAALAGAANTLCFPEQNTEAIYADNTDGVGLINDICQNCGRDIAGQRVLLLGAGGAAHGVLGALAEKVPARLVVANRSIDKAVALVARLNRPMGDPTIAAIEPALLDEQKFDIVINATSAGLSGLPFEVSTTWFSKDCLAYDMTYARGTTPFLAAAIRAGASTADGIGMLVEQAAEAFFIWRGVRPDTSPVIAAIRATL